MPKKKAPANEDLAGKFNSEKELQSFVINNIEMFCRDILHDDVVSFKEQKSMERISSIPPRRMLTADIFIEGKKNNYIVEIKNTDNGNSVRGALGQILCYSVSYGSQDAELIILSSKADNHVVKAISRYKLPVRFILLQDNILSELKYNEET